MKSIMMILLSLIVLGGCSSTRSEQEPNNNPAQAQPVQLGETIEGDVRTRRDKDYYHLSIPDSRLVNRALRIVLKHASSTDLRLTVYRDRKRLLRLDDYAAPSTSRGRKIHPQNKQISEELANLALFPGEYLFVVEAAPWQQGVWPAPYLLSLKSEGRSEFSEIEPNNSRKEATPLEPGVAVEGYLSPYSDPLSPDLLEKDYYSLSLDVSNKTVLDVTVTGVPGTDIGVTFMDPRGRILRKGDAAGMHRGEKLQRIGIRKSGTYFVLVTSKKPFSGSHSAPYTIRVDRQTHEKGQELEPNDSIKDANPAEIGQPISGLLTPEKDRDYYRIMIPQPGKYTFSARLKDVPGVDTELKVFDKTGRELIAINLAGSGEPEYIANLPLQSSQYDQPFFIMVGSRSGQNSEDSYQLDISLYEANLMGEYGDNETREKSNPLSLNVEKKGFLYPQDDRDWYTFSLEENRNIRLSVSGVTGVDLLLKLYGEDGKLLRSVNGAGLHEGESIITDLPGPAGYFVQVRGKESSHANAREPYTILVRTGGPRRLPSGKTLPQPIGTATTNSRMTNTSTAATNGE